ncbi:unnamed protein product [Cuscuta europaea]|uniref:C2H2-type domain-containing protein n=1 Tax=Cuscuta europaea TaxID=41803 RepID=A0A9P1E3C7_CUSEU|nr:unnamed protein product [Cuscuta europaea]
MHAAKQVKSEAGIYFEYIMGEKKKKKDMPSGRVWFSLKRSMQCKSLEASEVGRPKSSWGCSRSISNLKDVVIHYGSRRHLEKAGSCSPTSIGSTDFLTLHPLVLHHTSSGSSGRCSELRITRFASGGGGGGSFVGTLRPGTPGPGPGPAPGGHHHHHHHRRASSAHHYLNSFSLTRNTTTPASRGRRPWASSLGEKSQGLELSSKLRAASLSLERNASINNGSSPSSSSVTCHKCGKQFSKWEALQLHHLSHHAVTELLEGDSSRKIVEIICRSSWLKKSGSGIERVLKVHNTQKTVARFEEYREMVKARAGKLAKRHPRCLADGNELLRFYGTTVACSLGDSGGPCTLCTSDKCHVCQVIRNGGLSIKDGSGIGGGVFTTSTSGRALESIQLSAAAAAAADGEEDSNPPPLYQRKAALIVCRVIAGRVHRPLENIQEMAGQTGFDSLAGKVGLHSNIEELYLLSPRALLPCFVVICKSYSPFSLLK